MEDTCGIRGIPGTRRKYNEASRIIAAWGGGNYTLALLIGYYIDYYNIHTILQHTLLIDYKVFFVCIF